MNQVMASCYNSTMNDHYIYVWKEQGVTGSGLPFYVGQGTHNIKRGKYDRAITNHRTTGGISYAQKNANKLAKLGTPHVVEILYDNLTQEEADELEKTLISRLGRRINNTGILCNISEGADFKPHLIDAVRLKRAETLRKTLSNRVKSPLNYRTFAKIIEELSITRYEYDGVIYKSINEICKKFNITRDMYYVRSTKGIDLIDSSNSTSKKTIEYDGKSYKSYHELARAFNMKANRVWQLLKEGRRLDE